MYQQATSFIHSCYEELGKKDEETRRRLQQIQDEIGSTGTYEHTYEELEHGARMAWRHNNRCIGRLFWKTLHVMDRRDCNSAEGVFESLLEHIKYATNEGKIRPVISIYKAQKNGEDELRIWNHQLIRYAGYENNGEIIGDSASVEFTNICKHLGWKGKGTAFDILPLVIKIKDAEPELFEIPLEVVMQVDLEHPSIAQFKELRTRWYAVPIISDMCLEIGGIQYTAAPFNGWYMGTEIGARNLADEERYNLLPKISEIMNLDMTSKYSLWKDEALVQLNIAVLHSFHEKGVTIIDHHTAAHQFQRFEKKEIEQGRQLTGNWVWLIPPMSPATTHIYHKPYRNETISPNYFYQDRPYK